MDSDTVSDIIGGVVRHIVTSAGGGLVAHGLINSDQLTQIAGASALIVGICWSAYQKYQANKPAPNPNLASKGS